MVVPCWWVRWACFLPPDCRPCGAFWCMLPVSAGLSPNIFSSGNGGIFMSENTPKRIGDYEVIRELGHGGMGEVYLVRNVLSDRTEAMKVLLPSLAGRSEFVARFMRE